jgi:hypothetical protein
LFEYCRAPGDEQRQRLKVPHRVRRKQFCRTCPIDWDLVYYHEKSVEGCAHILGIPAATVKTRMFYAREKLAQLEQEA